MKKAGRKVLHFTGKLNTTIQPGISHSQSTAMLQRKGSTPLRVMRDVREARGGDKHATPERNKAASRTRSIPQVIKNTNEDDEIAPPPQQFGIPHRHRLSVDGTMGLQALIQERLASSSPQAKGKSPSKLRGKAPVAASSKELIRFVKANGSVGSANQTFAADSSMDSSMSLTQKPQLSRANSRTRLRLSNSQSVPQIHQLDAPKLVQKIGYKTQTGSINGKPKRNNQDSFLICQDYGGVKNQWLFGVLDGHGLNGHDVSAHIKKSLPQHFLQYISKTTKQVTEEEIRALSMGLCSSFLKVNSELMRAAHIDSTMSGSTAVAVYVRGDLVLCANAGDSRAIVGRLRNNDSWIAIPLSKDHKPDDPVERARIEQCGGRVEPFQVWNLREQVPGLAMSRSLGDFIASEIGVTAEPEVTRLNIGREDKFIVLASDGIWEFISSQAVSATQCVDFVAPFWQSGNVEAACDRLVREAVTCWRRVSARQEDDVVDDITVIIAFFLP